MIVAKLLCTEITAHAPEKWEGGDPHGKKTVTLLPVTSSDPQDAENYAFGQATPSGDVILMMSHEAAGFFSPGEEVYVAFTKQRP